MIKHDPAPAVIHVSGPTGCGKTTIALAIQRMLSKELGRESAVVDQYDSMGNAQTFADMTGVTVILDGPPMPRAKPCVTALSVLRSGADIIERRGQERDRPGGERTMVAIVDAFNTIFADSIADNDGHLTETQGWQFMELLKMARSAYGVYVPDDHADAVNYAALAAEAAAAQEAAMTAEGL